MSTLHPGHAIVGAPHASDVQPQRGTRKKLCRNWSKGLFAYLELIKPRVALLSLATVAVGYLLGSQGPPDVLGLLHTLAGAGMIAAGSCALNQWIERRSDARMRRTAARPLPAGRLDPRAALLFGVVLCVAGTLYLALAVHVLAALLGLAIEVTYLLAYTPLKRRSTLNTAVGAVSGALPPVLGWAAAAGAVSTGAGALFLIVFLWQFPHFLAIAWIHRRDYARVGMRMLPVVDPRGVLTGCHVLAYTLTLLPISLAPAVFGLAGPRYFLGALALGVWFLFFAGRFWIHTAHARALLRASLVYLPLLFALLLADRRTVGEAHVPRAERSAPAYRVAAVVGTAEPSTVTSDD